MKTMKIINDLHALQDCVQLFFVSEVSISNKNKEEKTQKDM